MSTSECIDGMEAPGSQGLVSRDEPFAPPRSGDELPPMYPYLVLRTGSRDSPAGQFHVTPSSRSRENEC